jgi:photosystem II stability/assembly factor-like uncharacterized protein
MSDRIHVATRKGLVEIERREATSERWHIRRTDFLGEPVTMVLPDSRTGTVYAALRHGHFGAKLHRARNGQSWQECSMPAFPAVADDEKSKAPAVDQIMALETGGLDKSGVLWAGTVPGALFRSENEGDSWRLIDSLWNRPERAEWFGGGYDAPGIHSICVDPRDCNHVTISVSCGGVWTTFDSGRTWEVRTKGMRAAYMPPERAFDPNVQDPHRLVQCGADPDVFWVQHHNGIFRSTDAAANWAEITGVEPSVFGFAVAAHPDDANTAWFVPAVKDECRVPVNGSLVVTRTTDGGKTFAVLREGLPQKNSYDLVYRHALDVDESGERLAMGSTTGNLWVSENGGEHWMCVSNHLAPVYCVRFA